MRQVEVITTKDHQRRVEEKLATLQVDPVWIFPTVDDEVLLKFGMSTEQSAEVLDELEEFLDRVPCKVFVHAIESSLPGPDKEEEEEAEELIQLGKFARISKSELYQDIASPARLTLNFVFMVALSAIVAGIGLLKNNVPIIIGAMVIAPFLSPNIAIAFATTVGDISLNRRALVSLLTATGVVLAIAIPWGYFDPQVTNIEFSPVLEYRDILLALACGFAGVLSLIGTEATALVGVMVAAALVPPLVMGGLFLGGGMFQDARNALLLYSINIVCLNLSGIITFYFSGLRPARWWDQERAGKYTRNALLVLTSMLALLALFIYLTNHPNLDFTRI